MTTAAGRLEDHIVGSLCHGVSTWEYCHSRSGHDCLSSAVIATAAEGRLSYIALTAGLSFCLVLSVAQMHVQPACQGMLSQRWCCSSVNQVMSMAGRRPGGRGAYTVDHYWYLSLYIIIHHDMTALSRYGSKCIMTGINTGQQCNTPPPAPPTPWVPTPSSTLIY